LSSQLIDQNILRSEKLSATSGKTVRGRPKNILSLNPDAGFTVVVTLLIDHLEVQLVDYAGQVQDARVLEPKTRELSVKALSTLLIDAITAICTATSRENLQYILLAFQGVTEHATGTLLWSPILKTTNVPVGKILEEQFSVPVGVENDCQLMSEALSQIYKEQLGHSFASVLFSHGIGLGLYLNGESFSGIRSSALELGHLRFERHGALCRCGKRGCIEAYAADYGIERLATGESIEDTPSGRVSPEALDLLIKKAEDGDVACQQAFAIAGAAVAEGLVGLFTLLDPMPVALIGHDQAAFELMRNGLESVFRQNLSGESNPADFLHFFNNEEELLNIGMIQNSLRKVDQLFSDPNIQIHLQ